MGAQVAPDVDLLLDAERARQAANAAIARPIARARGSRDSGDGDQCPLNPSHGKMYVLGNALLGGTQQYCSHHSHDNKPMTRCFWPLQGFEAAVHRHANAHPPKEAT